MKTHYITAINPHTKREIEFEYQARDSRHARNLFAQQYPGWKVKTCNTTADTIGKILMIGLCVVSTGAVAIEHLPKAYPSVDFPFEASENR
jgi:hypothetical protein